MLAVAFDAMAYTRDAFRGSTSLLFVVESGHTFRRRHKSRIRQRHSHIFCLPAIDRIRRHRVAKELAFTAAACLASDTEVAFLAGCVEGHHHYKPASQYDQRSGILGEQ